MDPDLDDIITSSDRILQNNFHKNSFMRVDERYMSLKVDRKSRISFRSQPCHVLSIDRSFELLASNTTRVYPRYQISPLSNQNVQRTGKSDFLSLLDAFALNTTSNEIKASGNLMGRVNMYIDEIIRHRSATTASDSQAFTTAAKQRGFTLGRCALYSFLKRFYFYRFRQGESTLDPHSHDEMAMYLSDEFGFLYDFDVADELSDVVNQILKEQKSG
jgi:hypothetical protein